MSKKICCIFNYAPHYRTAIYKLMDQQLDCDFYFGHKVESPIKKMDYSKLANFKKEVRNSWILGTTFIWQYGVWQLVFKRYKYFILTGQPNILSYWVILILGKMMGKKVMVWTHGLKEHPSHKHTWFTLTFFKLCHKLLLYGNHSKKMMLQRDFKEEKMVCLYNSLDYKKQREIRENLKKTDIYTNFFKNDDPVIIYVGRIQKSKNLEWLVKALKEFNTQDLGCNLVFVGRDLEDNKVKELVNTLNMEKRVLFYGPCYEEEKLGELIYNAAVCVSPGPIGLTAIHSLTYGTPAISNDDYYQQMPEFEVIQEGKSGGFYKKNDFEDFVDTIKTWIHKTEEARNKIRKNCYSIIDEKWNPFYQLKVLKSVTNR